MDARQVFLSKSSLTRRRLCIGPSYNKIGLVSEEQNPLLDPKNSSLLQINQTPVGTQNQSSQLRYAGLFVRWVAAFIDGLIILPILLLFIWIIALIGKSTDLDKVADKAEIFAGLIWLPLNLYFVTKYGATPGKMVMKLRIIKEDGSVPDFKTAFKREIIGKIVSGLFLNLGYIWIAFDKEKQGIHDKIAKTHVIRLR